MRILFFGLLILLGFLLRGQAPLSDLQKEGEWVLMMAPGLACPVLEDVGLIRPLSAGTGAFLIQFGREEEYSIREQLGRVPGFLGLQPNFYLFARGVEPDDPFFEAQWNMERIQAPDAWAFATGGQTALGDQIVVAVMDDGFDLEHPELAGNLWTNTAESQGLPLVDEDQNGYTDDVQGWNFDDSTPILPVRSHGTAVLGILGARGNNDAGIAGVNWEVQMLPMVVRTIGDIIEAYEYCFQLRKKYNQSQGAEGAYIVATNASLGFNKVFCSDFPSLEAIFDSLGHAGVLSVGATANGHWDVDVEGDIPTSCRSDYMIAVTNADFYDEKNEEAAFGLESIDLAAPGGSPDEGVYTIAPGDYDQSFGGTSASSPHVAGAVALLYSIPSVPFAQMAKASPRETALLVRDAILGGVDSLFTFHGLTATGGRLNLFRSVLYMHGALQPIGLDDPGQYADRRRLIRVFPNPLFSGQPIQVVYGSRDLEPVTLHLFNALGQRVAQVSATPEAFAGQVISLPTSNLAPGTYWVVLENGIGPISEKVIVY